MWLTIWIQSYVLQCISFFQLGDGQSCLLFDVVTSDIAKKKINGEHEQLGLMHWKGDFPLKCSAFIDFENESIDFYSFFFPRFWWSHHGENVMSLSFSFCACRWAFTGIKIWVLRTPCGVWMNILQFGCCCKKKKKNTIFASFHYMFLRFSMN